MFQQTYQNALTSNSPVTQQPTHLQTTLKVHQLALLHEMRKRESQFRQGMPIYKNQVLVQTLFSDFGILGDSGGTGKTLTALGHISQMALQPLHENQSHKQDKGGNQLSNLHPESSASCFSILPQANTQSLFDSLIVVPHIIFRQWQEVIENETTLKACFIKSQRDLDKDSLVTQLQESHVALIGNTLLSGFLNNLKARNVGDVRWRRVFYDEADSIKLAGNCPRPQANMSWLITSNFQNLLLANECYHSYILRQLAEDYLLTLPEELQTFLRNKISAHPNVTFFKTQSYPFFQYFLKTQHPLRFLLVLLCKREFLDQSTQRMPIQHEIVRCQAPPSHNMIESVIPTEVQAMLNAGDIQGALQSLGVPSHTPLTLVQAATEFHRRRIQELEKNPGNEKKIEDLQEKIKAVESRIQELSKDNCSICYDTPGIEEESNCLVTPCCSRLFCAPCILSWMTRTAVCPLCRAELAPTALCSLGRTLDKSGEGQHKPPRLPKKHEALVKLIKENPNGKYLVFSRYDNSFFLLRKYLIDHEIVWGMIEGNKDSIGNTLERFQAGSIQVLFLNNKQAVAGLNIPSATHIILLHKMQQDEETIIVNRAYRLGRKEPLKLIKLLHERE